jgi:hypothetical protein
MSDNGPGVSGLGGGAQPFNMNEFLAGAYGGGNQTSAYGAMPGQDRMVYMGPGFARPATPNRKGARGTPADPGMRSIADAQKEYWNWKPGTPERQLWDEYTEADFGYIPGDNAAEGLWANVLEGLAARQAATGEKIDPFQYMQSIIDYRKGMGSDKKGGGGSTTRRVVNLTNPQDAAVLVDNALGQYLGRQATSAEVDKFLSVLNKIERKNPIVSTASGQSGGVNQELAAKEFAQSREGAAEFTATTEYMDWLMQSLSKDPLGGMKSGL